MRGGGGGGGWWGEVELLSAHSKHTYVDLSPTEVD